MAVLRVIVSAHLACLSRLNLFSLLFIIYFCRCYFANASGRFIFSFVHYEIVHAARQHTLFLSLFARYFHISLPSFVYCHCYVLICVWTIPLKTFAVYAVSDGKTCENCIHIESPKEISSIANESLLTPTTYLAQLLVAH